MNSITRLKVIKLWDETPDTTGLLLQSSDGEIKSFKSGQFITLLPRIDGKEARRGYSIFTQPGDLPIIGLAIKRVKDGLISRYIGDTLREGSTIKAIGPAGNFVIEADRSKKRNVVLVGAGSGITPLMSMLSALLKDEPLSNVILLYGNRSERDIIFREKLDEYRIRYGDRFRLLHSLTEPSSGWDGAKGRISSEKLNYFFNKLKFYPDENTEFYLCGPEEMMKDLTVYLKDSGISGDKIFREHYKVSVVDESFPDDAVPRRVTILRGGERHEILVEPSMSILETALQHNIDLPNSCQYGSCGSCKAKLISGKIKLVEQSALTEEELEEGYCLTCVGYPVSDNVVVYYEGDFD